MRIRIDADLCQGMGECRDLVPGLITFDALGIASIVDEQLEVDPEMAHRLVSICPSSAITVNG
jgi:ferredoxin